LVEVRTLRRREEDIKPRGASEKRRQQRTRKNIPVLLREGTILNYVWEKSAETPLESSSWK